jgi:hypothetical protein
MDIMCHIWIWYKPSMKRSLGSLVVTKLPKLRYHVDLAQLLFFTIYLLLLWAVCVIMCGSKGHETECLWRVHFKHSHWWKRRSRVKFAASHYTWGTNGVSMWMQDGCKGYMDSHKALNGSCFMVTWTILQKSPLVGRPNTKPLGDHGTLNAHSCWFIISNHVWGPAWKEFIEIAFGWGSGHIWLHTTLKLMCSCLCLFHTTVKLHAMDEENRIKISITFSSESESDF